MLKPCSKRQDFIVFDVKEQRESGRQLFYSSERPPGLEGPKALKMFKIAQIYEMFRANNGATGSRTGACYEVDIQSSIS